MASLGEAVDDATGKKADMSWLMEGIEARTKALAGLIVSFHSGGKGGGGGLSQDALSRARNAEAGRDALEDCAHLSAGKIREAQEKALRATQEAWRARRALERVWYSVRDSAPGVAKALCDALAESGGGEPGSGEDGRRKDVAPGGGGGVFPVSESVSSSGNAGENNAATGVHSGNDGGIGSAPAPLQLHGGPALGDALVEHPSSSDASSSSAGLSSPTVLESEIASLKDERKALREQCTVMSEELEILRDNLDVAETISLARNQQCEDLRARVLEVERQLNAEIVGTGGGLSEGAVLSHPRHLSLLHALGEAQDALSRGGATVSHLESCLKATQGALAAETARASALVALAGERERAQRSALESRLWDLENRLAASVRERDAAVVAAGEARAAAASLPSIQTSLAEAHKLAADRAKHIEVLKATVAARDPGSDAAGGEDPLIPLSSLMAVSDALEAANKDRDRLVAAMSGKDEECFAANTAMVRAEASRAGLLARAEAAEAAGKDLAAVRTASAALSVARDAVVEEALARAGRAEIEAATATAAAAAATAAAGGGGGTGGAPRHQPINQHHNLSLREYKASLEALELRCKLAEERLEECSRARAAAEEKEGKTGEALVTKGKQLAKAQKALKEAQDAAAAAARGVPGRGLSLSSVGDSLGGGVSPMSGGLAELVSLRAIAKCSVCSHVNMRDTILQRCGHTFCRRCIDTRYANRQRKCPTCGQGFSAEDVKPVYFI